MIPKFQISNLKSLWWFLRQFSGDAAYENYLRSVKRTPVEPDLRVRPNASRTPARSEPPIMSREEFFLDSLRRRYSSISRCC